MTDMNNRIAANVPAVEFRQFLSDVMTAAGLVTHGKQCKSLGERLGEGCMKYSSLFPTPPTVHEAVPAGDIECRFVVWWAHNRSKFTTSRQAARAAMFDAIQADRPRRAGNADAARNAALEEAAQVVYRFTGIPPDALRRGTGVRDQLVVTGERIMEALRSMKSVPAADAAMSKGDAS